MKIMSEKIKEVVVGKNEAGLFQFKDTNVTIEMGDAAFVIKEENPFSGTVDNVYFKKRESAEKYS